MPYFEIPWNLFMTDEDKQSLVREEETALNVEALSLHFEKDKGTIAKWERLTPLLSNLIKEKSFYMDGALNRDGFNQPIKELVDAEGSDKVANKLFEVLEDVYKDANQEVYSLTFVSYERMHPQDSEEVSTIHLSLNVIGDELSVDTIPIEVRINDFGNILEIAVRKGQEQNNTPRGLSLDAYFDEDTEQTALNFIDQLEEEMVKHSYEADDKKTVNHVLNQVEEDLNALESEEATFKAIESWIHQSKGKFKSQIIGLEYSDIGANPVTNYQLAVPNTESIETYVLTIDRSKNEIVQIIKEEK